jgi:hypothetical protein
MPTDAGVTENVEGAKAVPGIISLPPFSVLGGFSRRDETPDDSDHPTSTIQGRHSLGARHAGPWGMVPGLFFCAIIEGELPASLGNRGWKLSGAAQRAICWEGT